MKIVQQLTKPYEGTHRSICIDGFYASIELLKELTKMNLHVRGTVSSTRLPKEVQILRASKLLERGQNVHHRCDRCNEKKQ